MEGMYPKIEPDDLGRFHASIGLNIPPCWICSHVNWLLQSTDADPFRIIPSFDGISPTLGTQSFAIVPLTCLSCGTVWQVSYPVVRSWIKANPAKESGTDG